MRKNITTVFKRKSFTYICFMLGLVYSVLNVAAFIYDQNGRTGIDRARFVLYHACMDPTSHFSIPLVKVMPISQFFLYGMNIINISCNFYLYNFLEDRRKQKHESMT